MNLHVQSPRARSLWLNVLITGLAVLLVHVFLVQLPSYLVQTVASSSDATPFASEAVSGEAVSGETVSVETDGSSGIGATPGPRVLSAPDPN